MASPLFDLSGKVAVVTGSSKGIGKSIALHLALQGAKVVVSSRKAPACEAAAAEIRKAGGHATVIPCNISDKAQVERLIAETRKQLGPVDVLVCNAASNPYYGPNEKLPDEVFMKVMQNNILSNMWLINLCLPDM
ncbi:MAG: SDR family NAD(P)-dependent oxidoreductase, partial [Reyranellales bacterium]